jgi:hypothetical protein
LGKVGSNLDSARCLGCPLSEGSLTVVESEGLVGRSNSELIKVCLNESETLIQFLRARITHDLRHLSLMREKEEDHGEDHADRES